MKEWEKWPLSIILCRQKRGKVGYLDKVDKWGQPSHSVIFANSSKNIILLYNIANLRAAKIKLKMTELKKIDVENP